MTKNQLWLVVSALALVAIGLLLMPGRSSERRGDRAAVVTAPGTLPAQTAATNSQASAAASPTGSTAAVTRAGTSDSEIPQRAASTPVASGATQTGGTPAVSSVLAEASASQATMIDLDTTRRAVRDYRTLMGENPVGTNAEIMKALMGGNPRQAVVGPGEGQHLNAKGELIDQWGTPYFFHQLSGTQMEIHSAGPDKIMGTDDDLVLK